MSRAGVESRRALVSMRPIATGLVRAVEALDRFTRIHFFGYTSFWPLLGAASAEPDLRPATLVGILGLSLLFHFYGGVLNDVADLEVDRSQPARCRDPLVRGTVGRSTALAFALGQVPLGFLWTAWLSLDLRAYLLLAGAFAAMAIYDLWSKRSSFPPLVEAAQGLAWICLILYGAQLSGRPPNGLTYLVATYAVAYTLIMNGIHGGLRDIENDYACGVRTTAILLGVRPTGDRGLRVPRPVWVYCFSVQTLLALLGLLPLSRYGAGYGGATWWVILALVLLANVLNFGLMRRVLEPSRPGWEMVFRFHMFSMLLPLLLSLSAWPRVWLALAIPTILLVPMLLIAEVRRMLRQVLRRVGLARAGHRLPWSTNGRPSGRRDRLRRAADPGDRARRGRRPRTPKPLPRRRGAPAPRVLGLLFDRGGRLLIQQRSRHKRLWPLYWSNRCCGHPRWGERTGDAAQRRLREELGLSCRLRRAFKFQYCASFEDRGSENEVCVVYVGRAGPGVRAEPREIGDWAFMSASELDRELDRDRARYTPWFGIGWERLRDVRRRRWPP
jgi:isopentenyl-diphosphate delta-isomerase